MTSHIVDYRCGSCGQITRTIKIDDGDTPMFTHCPRRVQMGSGGTTGYRVPMHATCGGVMRSQFGKVADGNGLAPMVWVKPTLADRRAASPERRAEYDAGRLILKKEASAIGAL